MERLYKDTVHMIAVVMHVWIGIYCLFEEQ